MPNPAISPLLSCLISINQLPYLHYLVTHFLHIQYLPPLLHLDNHFHHIALHFYHLCRQSFSSHSISISQTIGWVNLYKKIEMEKYTLILPIKMERHKKKKFNTFCIRICMDLRIFANFLFPTLLKICSKKFDKRQLTFCYYMYCKKI